MRLPPPSLGLAYLLATLLGSGLFFHHVTGPFFFELPAGSAAAELGESNYLLKLAEESHGATRARLLDKARTLAKKHGDARLLLDIEAAPEHWRDAHFVAAQPGVWLAGFDRSRRTHATETGRIRISNPVDKAVRVRLDFQAEQASRMICSLTDKPVEMTLSGDSKYECSFESPPIPPGDSIEVAVRMLEMAPGAQTGIRFLRAVPRP